MPGLAKLAWESLGPTPLPDDPAGTAALRDRLADSLQLRDLIDRAAAAAEPILLIVNDSHRATRTRTALDALNEVIGRRAGTLRFRALVATGTHRFADQERREFETATFGGCGLNIEQVAWHDADDASVLADIAGVRLHRWLAAARFIVPIGSVEPHYFAGVSGAHKTATIGCLARQDIEQNHAGAMEPTSDILRLEGNPVFEGVVDILRTLAAEGKRFVGINEVVRGDVLVSAAVGDPLDTLYALLPVVRRMFLREIGEPVDLLHLKVPLPLGRNLYQADKALKNNHTAVRDGGGIVLEADCPEGVGPDAFLTLLSRAGDYATARRIVREEGYRLGDHKAVKLRYLTDRAARGVHVIIVSPNIDPDVGRAAAMQVSTKADSALQRLGQTVTGLLQRGLVVDDAGVVAVTVGRG